MVHPVAAGSASLLLLLLLRGASLVKLFVLANRGQHKQQQPGQPNKQPGQVERQVVVLRHVRDPS